MMEEFILDILEKFGFPAFIAIVLLWDRIKTNGTLLKVVENNNSLLKSIKNKIK